MPELTATAGCSKFRTAAIIAAGALAASCGGGSGSGPAAAVPQVQKPPPNPAQVSYVDLQQGFDYQPGKTSPLEKAFQDAGISAVVTDHSSQAHVLDTTVHGNQIMTVLAANGLQEGRNYSYRQVSRMGFTRRINYAQARSFYRTTSADSITSMSFHPVFTSDETYDGIGADIRNHSWVLAATGNGGRPGPPHVITGGTLSNPQKALKAGTDNAVASGKFRYVYGLNEEQSDRHPQSNGCKDYEQYCIGAPFQFRIVFGTTVTVLSGTSFATPYVFAAMLIAWERLPAAATAATVFAMADKCTIDIGEKGFDSNTGRGRLDIGCMARETAAQAAGTNAAGPAVSDAFVHGLFSAQLGRLHLPGATDAQLQVSLIGDSLQGRYRPAAPAGDAYRPDPPELHHWHAGPSSVGLAYGPGNEAGLAVTGGRIFAALTGRSSRDFFGGSGSGRFALTSISSLRLLVQGQLASGHWQLWSKHSKLSTPHPAIDSLRGREIGAALAWQARPFAKTALAIRGWIAQFRGGSISLQGSPAFRISPADVHYGLQMQFRHFF